jgi:hypothetical protein
MKPIRSYKEFEAHGIEYLHGSLTVQNQVRLLTIKYWANCLKQN